MHATLHATDADGDPLTFSIADAPDHAVVTLDAATGTFDLQPLANYFGADSFEYSVSDGHGNVAQARVDVTVQPVARSTRHRRQRNGGGGRRRAGCTSCTLRLPILTATP